MTLEVGGKASSKLFAERYQLIELLGKGGMAEVYRAKDTSLGTEVALKILLKNLSSNEHERERFLREARITRKIQHPNVVRTYDVGESEGRPFFVMELLEGVTLKKIIEDNGALPIGDAMAIAEKILSGLESVHGAGVIHKDIKPSNILFTKPASNKDTGLRLTEKKFGIIKITDFGVAREVEDLLDGEDEMVGSAPYMAPETWKKLGVTQASDLYAFGALFYEMLTGKPPFEGESSFELMAKHYEETVPKVVSPHGDLANWVQKYLEKLLAKNAVERFQNAGEALSILFHATSAPDEVEIHSAALCTSTTYKRAEYVADDQKVEHVDETSISFKKIFLNLIIVGSFFAIGYFFFISYVSDGLTFLREATLPISASDTLLLLSAYFAIVTIPITCLATWKVGLKGGLMGWCSSIIVMLVATVIYFHLISYSEGLSAGAVQEFYQTKQGKIALAESISRVTEVALLLPPNSLGVVVEIKKQRVEKRTRISGILQLVTVYGGWFALYSFVTLCYFGRFLTLLGMVSVLFSISASLIDSFARSSNLTLLGSLHITTPFPLMIPISALITSLLVGVFLWHSYSYEQSEINLPQIARK